MTINVKGLGAADLTKLLADVQAAIAAQAKIGKLREEITARLEREGLTVEDVFPRPQAPERSGRGGRPRNSENGFASVRGRQPVGDAKYANPENAADTWTGRGRKPQWCVEHLAAGGTLDDLLISKA